MGGGIAPLRGGRSFARTRRVDGTGAGPSPSSPPFLLLALAHTRKRKEGKKEEEEEGGGKKRKKESLPR